MVKVGLRKPNLKTSLKARTTGRAKRAVKRAIIPGYGKKGMGWIKNPKKAAYNAVYSRTTVGVGDVARAVAKSGARSSASRTSSITVSSHEITPLAKPVWRSLNRNLSLERLRRLTGQARRFCYASFLGGRALIGRMHGCGVASFYISLPLAFLDLVGCLIL